MTTQPFSHESPASSTVDARTHVGPVELRVADLARSLRFYQQVIGLQVLNQRPGSATLGVGDTTLLTLHEVAGARPVPVRTTGLYHFAILVPTAADLGHALRRLIVAGVPVGQGDHLVSEALYLSDPDDNGIELYRDRPRDTWRWKDSMVQMATDPVDLHALLEAAEREGGSPATMPIGTTMGHVHLKVADIAQARAFFVDTLGFAVTAQMPSALFVSAGGYHHHFGLNIWHSRGAAPASPTDAGLTSYSIVLPDLKARDSVLERLRQAGIAYSPRGNDVVLRDPWHNEVVLVVAQSEE